jgi:hypothetical protein
MPITVNISSILQSAVRLYAGLANVTEEICGKLNRGFHGGLAQTPVLRVSDFPKGLAGLAAGSAGILPAWRAGEV